MKQLWESAPRDEKVEELVARCEEVLEQIEAQKDFGVYALKYKYDVRELLDLVAKLRPARDEKAEYEADDTATNG